MAERGMIKERKGLLSVLLHVTGWIILFILPQFLVTGGGFEDTRTTLIIFFNTLVFGIIFYINYLWLVPLILHKGRWPVYVGVMIALVITVHFVSNFAFQKAFPPPPAVEQRMRDENQKDDNHRKGRRSFARMMTYNYFITAFLVTGFAVGLRSVEQSLRKEREIKELEQEKLNSELALLKNQVSPHFFFNTLNNIYSLIEINQKDAQEAVLSLSKMMRYMLYESEKGNTKLSRELDFMKVYIDLMKLRISDKVKLTVDFPEKYDDTDILPLLFIPFIENAFKHGVSVRKNAFISIGLLLEGDCIRFTAANSINQVKNGSPEADSGIGLENVRKRLALLYPGRHELNISDDGTVYNVELKINTASQPDIMIKVVAIDDEPLALQLVKGYIEKTPFLELAGAFDNPVDAVGYIKSSIVDLVLLDIQMPDITGTELASVISGGPKIIFTTAYEKYALEGFRLDAVDYLLKPFSYAEFLKAVQKAQKLIDLETKQLPSLEVKNDFLFIKSEYKIRRINFSEINYIEGLRDYVKIFLTEEKKPVLSLSTLKALEARLPEERFMRVHRSFIVSLEKVKVIDRNRIVFGEVRIPVTEQYKDSFQKFLGRNFI